MEILVVIPARGGSKGVPGKNIKLLHNKPLLYYTLDAATQAFPKSDICLSTDDPKIIEIAKNYGIEVPFIRPQELASDTAGMYEVLIHALEFFEAKNNKKYDVLILLQPTSPLRNAQHIQEALLQYSNDLDMVVSVKETNSNPYYVLFEENENGFLRKSKEAPFIRRQDCPKVWEYNGAIYIINVNSLRKNKLHEFTKVKKYEMDELHSFDIDTPLDWLIIETIINSGLN